MAGRSRSQGGWSTSSRFAPEQGSWLRRAEAVRLSAERLAALPAEGRHLPVTGPEDMLAGMLAEHRELSKRAQHADGIDTALIQAMGVEGVIEDGL